MSNSLLDLSELSMQNSEDHEAEGHPAPHARRHQRFCHICSLLLHIHSVPQIPEDANFIANSTREMSNSLLDLSELSMQNSEDHEAEGHPAPHARR
ncbi:hypothetical protein QE152_g26872 [Popillia japonica]|uniref:Uncharacterized protein n=1 Tax=Popillia japonica TaxID=7064 RepID=A0AAW1JVF0_POPJA